MKATKNNVIEERFTVVIVRECLTALAFLHRSSVIHRDMKGTAPRCLRLTYPLTRYFSRECAGHGDRQSSYMRFWRVSRPCY